MKQPEKYTPVELPSRDEAHRLAEEREAWAKTAREQDKPGSAREFELTALMLRFYAGKAAVMVTIIVLLAGWAPFFDAIRTIEPRRAKSELALALRDYGMWREEHDRNTFPADMPKAGDPYDPVTGNAIRK